MKKYIWFLFLLIIIILGLFLYYKNQSNLIDKNVNNNKDIKKETITNFDSCVRAGGKIDHSNESSFCMINERSYWQDVPEGTIN